MSFRSLSLGLLLVCLPLVAACGSCTPDPTVNDAGGEDPGDPNDAGTHSIHDAGDGEPDAGDSEPDAGDSEPDAGVTVPDAGGSEEDAGSGDVDAGHDAGSRDDDAGTSDEDAGTADDAGGDEADAGEPDAGDDEPDAGDLDHDDDGVPNSVDVCPAFDDNACENGDCSSGSCVCQAGFEGAACDVCQTGLAGAACDECAPGFFGASCQSCPADCGNGVCDDGLLGSGQCLCQPGWFGDGCDEAARDCADLQQRDSSLPDGTYPIDPDGAGTGVAPFAASCDMTTEGGGWTLVLNYLHAGGTNPALVVRADDLPLLGPGVLGEDESAGEHWGHAGVVAMSRLDVGELRLFAQTSAHARAIDFITDDRPCIDYFQTGVGRCSGLDVEGVHLAGHSANLPGSFNSGYTDRGDFAMTEFPFYRAGTHHWGVRGLGQRWEVDDYPNNASQSTLHRIWVRPACPSGMFGADCADVCDCVNGTCDDGRYGSGSCICEPRFAGSDCGACSDGWSGASCDTAEGPNDPVLTSCTEIHALFPSAGSGSYLVDPDGAGTGLAPFEAYCDMSTDGGGWTLVLNYSHRGFSDPPLDVRTTDLPSVGLGMLATDESGGPSWGHAGNALLATFAPTELRFYGESASHSRRLHFKTDDDVCLDYVTTGTGHCRGTVVNFSPLAGHDSFLPASTNAGYGNQGESALTFHPFFEGGNRHWNIGASGRWEVDDYVGIVRHTLHRVFIRSQCPLGYTGPGCSERFPTCNALRDGFPGAPSGSYLIDPDGSGGEAPFEAHCDMTFDGGGWTLIMASNGLGPESQTEGLVTPGSGTYLSGARVQELADAALSRQVHIRTAGLAATESITSTHGSIAMVNLRALRLLNANSGMYAADDPVIGWTGPYAVDASILWHSCGAEPQGGGKMWPNVYWAGCNSSGLHLEGTNQSRWFYSTLPNSALEVYVR